MDVFEDLGRDHREVERLFARYAETSDDAIAQEICDALTLHAEIEARVLYPELRRLVDDGDDLANLAEAEHGVMRSMTARVDESRPIDLRPVLDGLRAAVTHHVAIEEEKLFPAMQAAGVDAERLGAELDAVRVELSPRRASPRRPGRVR